MLSIDTQLAVGAGAIFKYGAHMLHFAAAAQLIDDVEGRTIAAASSQEPDLRGSSLTVDTAAKVGELLGQRAKEAGVTEAVFDRGGYKYHGRVKALADAAREAGLEF